MVELVRLEQVPHLARAGGVWDVHLVVHRVGWQSFWHAHGLGNSDVAVTWGRTGTTGYAMTFDYETALVHIARKLASGYTYADGTDQRLPIASRPKQQRLRTLSERIANTSMRPMTQLQLMDLAGDMGLSPIHLDTDYKAIFRGADAVTLLQARHGSLVVVARYGDDLVVGSVKSM